MTTSEIDWRIAGEEFGGCNCAWGCPCQFNAAPTHGHCQGVAGFEIREGHFGSTPLDAIRFVWIFSFPGAIHEGNGTLQLIIDEQATPEQREALIALQTGAYGGKLFQIFDTVCSHRLDAVFAPITFQSDREHRKAKLNIPDLGEVLAEPIKNPVTGDEHRARIVLPGGFEYEEAEMGNALTVRAESVDPLNFEYANTYAQLNEFDWSSA